MAQAFAIIHGKGEVEAFSTGSRPSGKINPKAIAAMKKLGYDLNPHASKSIKETRTTCSFWRGRYHGLRRCLSLDGRQTITDWLIPDPREMNEDDFREVRNLIERKVKELIVMLQAGD